MPDLSQLRPLAPRPSPRPGAPAHTPYWRGAEASKAGQLVTTNPYAYGTYQFNDWRLGWLDEEWKGSWK